MSVCLHALLNMLSNVAVNSLGEMVSPCVTPLLILIFSLSSADVLSLSCQYICLSGFLCTHLLILVLAIMSILLGFVLNRMPSRNPRKQHIFTALLFKLVYGMYVICRIVLAPKSCLFSGLIFIQFLLQPSCYDFCEQFVHI